MFIFNYQESFSIHNIFLIIYKIIHIEYNIGNMNILKHFITIGLSSIINILISVLTTPIITRIVNPSDLGKINIFTSYVGIFASFFYFGLNDALYRFFYSYKKENGKRSLLKFCFLVPLYISLIASIIAIVLFKLNVIEVEYSLIIFVLLCINVIVTIWNSFSNEMLHNTQQSKKYSLAMLSQKIVYSVSVIVFVLMFNKNHLLILVLATTISTFISSLIGTLTTKEYWRFREVDFPSNKKEIMRYSLPIYIYFILFSIYDVLDKLLVEKFCSEYEVGIYSSAFALVGIFAIVQNAFNLVWRPLQTEKYTNNPDDTSFIKNGNRYMTIIMFFAGICVILFKDVLCLLLGEKYRIGAPLIPFLVFNPIMNTLIATTTSGIEYSKKSYIRTIIIAISLLLEISLSFILMPKLYAKGAAISMAISLIVQYLLTMYFSNKYYPIDYGIKNSILLIVLMLTYATLNVFLDSLFINVFMFILISITIVFLYKPDIIEMLNTLRSSLLNR